MKSNTIALVGGAIALAIAGFVIVRPVLALVDATSLPSAASTSTPSLLADSAADTSTSPASATSTTQTPATSTLPESSTTSTAATPPTQPAQTAPAGLSLVHIVGTKYTDYFTDGTTTVSFPGDPIIDGNLDKPNAPIPTHAGLTWDHTTGGYLYDTPSGDLELGDYAVQPSGSYIENAPPFVSSTSTPPAITTSATNDTATDTSASGTSVASPAVAEASTSAIAAPLDNSASTTSSDSTTSPAI
jgi:hypothetical protein